MFAFKIVVSSFVFPNTGHVIRLLGTVSFKFRLIHVHTYVLIIYGNTKNQLSLGRLLGKQNIQAKEVYSEVKNGIGRNGNGLIPSTPTLSSL